MTSKSEASITLKDHKPKFRYKPIRRLINPCKFGIGRISKLLENIIHIVKAKTNMKRWKNSNGVIKWFNNISDKTNHTMISFEYATIPYILDENGLKITIEANKKIVNYLHKTFDQRTRLQKRLQNR